MFFAPDWLHHCVAVEEWTTQGIIGYMLPTIWGVYFNWKYRLILDIWCQHLWDECKLEGFCVPFGHRIWECIFLKMYICIGYMLPTIWGVCVSWIYTLVLDISCQHFFILSTLHFVKFYFVNSAFCQLLFCQLCFGQLLFCQLCFGQLLFCQLCFGQLLFCQIYFDQLCVLSTLFCQLLFCQTMRSVRATRVSWKTKVGLWVGRALCEINDPRKFSFQTHLNNSDFEFKLSWGGN